MDIKTERIDIRCTAEERDAWKRTAAARGMTLSQAVRAHLERLRKAAERAADE